MVWSHKSPYLNKPMKEVTVILTGGPREERAALADTLTESFKQVEYKARIVTIHDQDDFAKICNIEVTKAKNNNGIIVAAGGDGTVNLIADLCYRHGVTLGIIPMGTFNYFARDLLISTEMDTAVKIIATGNTKQVSVGLVHNRVFLNNASFGLYTKLIREREQASSRFGRVRFIAALAAAYSLFDTHKLFTINISTDKEKRQYTTPMVFVGNNTLQLENLGLEAADDTKQDKLAMIIMKESSRWEIALFLLSGALKTLKNQSKLEEFGAENFEVTTSRKTIDLVIDGEIIRCNTPLEFKIHKKALTVLVPLEEKRVE